MIEKRTKKNIILLEIIQWNKYKIMIYVNIFIYIIKLIL